MGPRRSHASLVPLKLPSAPAPVPVLPLGGVASAAAGPLPSQASARDGALTERDLVGLKRAVEASPSTPQQQLDQLTPRSGSRAAQRAFITNLEDTLSALDTPRDGDVDSTPRRQSELTPEERSRSAFLLSGTPATGSESAAASPAGATPNAVARWGASTPALSPTAPSSIAADSAARVGGASAGGASASDVFGGSDTSPSSAGTPTPSGGGESPSALAALLADAALDDGASPSAALGGERARIRAPPAPSTPTLDELTPRAGARAAQRQYLMNLEDQFLISPRETPRPSTAVGGGGAAAAPSPPARAGRSPPSESFRDLDTGRVYDVAEVDSVVNARLTRPARAGGSAGADAATVGDGDGDGGGGGGGGGGRQPPHPMAHNAANARATAPSAASRRASGPAASKGYATGGWSTVAGLGDLAALAPPAPLPRIITALGLREKDVCNMWCGGSRLWGCATADSDYDLYVVHRAKEKALRVATKRLTKPARIDATILHADEWAERLRLHNPHWLLLISHPLPWMLRLDPARLGFDLTPQVQERMRP